MEDDGEPPGSPIVVVACYQIQQTVVIHNECRVTVVYGRYGTISDNFVLRRVKSEEIAHIWLARHPTAWQDQIMRRNTVKKHVVADLTARRRAEGVLFDDDDYQGG